MIDPVIKEQRIRWACGRKLKFTMEEAAQKFGAKPDDVLLYICPHCSFLHFGHKPTWEMSYDELIDKRRVKEAAQRRRELIEHKRAISSVRRYDGSPKTPNAARWLLARPESERAGELARQGYPGRVPFRAAAKRKQEDHPTMGVQRRSRIERDGRLNGTGSKVEAEGKAV